MDRIDESEQRRKMCVRLGVQIAVVFSLTENGTCIISASYV